MEVLLQTYINFLELKIRRQNCDITTSDICVDDGTASDNKKHLPTEMCVKAWSAPTKSNR
jgi:hypothetical protein